MVQMLSAGSVCGTVISLTLHTREPQSGDCLSFRLPENGTEMGEFLKNTLGPLLSLFRCPLAVSEIERGCEEKRVKGRRQAEERGGGGGGGGFVLAFMQ